MGWEEDLVAECRALLHTVVLQHNAPDQWHWSPNIMRGYTVRTGYHLLTSQDLPIVGTSDVLVWHKHSIKGLYSSLETTS